MPYHADNADCCARLQNLPAADGWNAGEGNLGSAEFLKSPCDSHLRIFSSKDACLHAEGIIICISLYYNKQH